MRGYQVDSLLVKVRNIHQIWHHSLAPWAPSVCRVGTNVLIWSSQLFIIIQEFLAGPGDGLNQFPTRGLDVFLLGYYAGFLRGRHDPINMEISAST